MLITALILLKIVQTIGYGFLLACGFWASKKFTTWMDEKLILRNKDLMETLGQEAFGVV